MLPVNSLDYDSVWSCSQDDCQASMESSTINTIMSTMEAELEGIDDCNVDVLQDLVIQWMKVLHPQHYLILLVKRKLLAAMKLVTSANPPRALLAQTIELAEESIRIFDVLDPGLTILKGRMLQYMNGPQLTLAKIALEVDLDNIQFIHL